MSIYLDAMGGDHSPDEIVKGAILAEDELKCEVSLIGNREEIVSVLKKMGIAANRFKITDAGEKIRMDEEPASAVKKKKDSSIVIGCGLIKGDRKSAFVSAGSTGALLAAALLYTGRIKGILRPAMGVILPSEKPIMLIDNGANADCKPEYLLQFAKMGSAYMKSVYGVQSPKVGLINIGAEAKKGNAFYRESYEFLTERLSDFSGNIEPKELFDSRLDVAVCDGFTGNIILKSLEGAFMYVAGSFKKVFLKNALNKLAAAVIKKDMREAKRAMDPAVTGGVPFLGVNGCVIKAHGSSDAIAIMNAVRQAVLITQNDLLKDISEIAD